MSSERYSIQRELLVQPTAVQESSSQGLSGAPEIAEQASWQGGSTTTVLRGKVADSPDCVLEEKCAGTEQHSCDLQMAYHEF